MPNLMLLDLSARLTTRHYDTDQVVCKRGDKGDCMYIIYRGEIGIYIGDKILKIFTNGEHLGRNALESNEPRSATLIAMCPTDLLLLSGQDY